MFTKILRHLRRISKAHRFGVRFVRRASFTIPNTVRLDGRYVPLASPDELGAKNDFLTCFIEDEYGLADIDFPIQTIVDIGSNIGFFSMASRSYFPTSTIHAYEPNPRVLPFTAKNAASSRFTLFGEAVGAAHGIVAIEDSGDSNQARTISGGESGVQVPQVTLATVVERLGGQIDLAKIDCEGAEWDMFRDAAAWAGIRHLRMEYHLWGKHTFGEVEQSLQRVGFQVHRHRPSGEWGIVWARNVKVTTSHQNI